MRRRTKNALILLLIVLIVLIVTILYGPKLFLKNIENRIHKVTIEQTDVKQNSLNLTIKIDVSGETIPAFVDSVGYEVVAYNSILARDVKRFTTEESRTGNLSFPVVIDNRGLVKEVKKHEGEKTLVEIVIYLYCSFPLLGTQRISTKRQVEIIVPIIPEVRIEDVKLVKLGLDNLVMKGIVSIYNPNNIDFTINHLTYQVRLGNYADTKGESEIKHHLKARDTTYVELVANIDIKHEFKLAWKALRGKDLPYHLNFDMNLKPSDSRLEKISIHAEKNGRISLSEGVDTVKKKGKVGIDEND